MISLKSVLNVMVVAALIIVTSCHKPDKTNKPAFDTQAMLNNLGNNVIIPSYQDLNSACINLDSAIAAFEIAPGANTLTALQNSFKEAYRKWQVCNVYQFGPAETVSLATHLNTFPTDTTQINSNITAGTYNLDALSNLDAQGFPAIDYLLFGVGSSANDIIAAYTTDGKAANRKQYLTSLSADIKSRVNTVTTSWLAGGGNYIGTFTSATGVDIGSSTGILVNQLNYYLDQIKNAKLGIPLGKQSMGTPFPDKVEAYYSGVSSELLLIQLTAIQNIYLGKSAQGDGAGLDDCLVQLNAQYNGGSLNDAIKNQFTVAITKVQALPNPLSTGIANNSTAANEAYTEIQKLIVLLKTDMPSSMGVLITYNDNDGD